MARCQRRPFASVFPTCSLVPLLAPLRTARSDFDVNWPPARSKEIAPTLDEFGQRGKAVEPTSSPSSPARQKAAKSRWNNLASTFRHARKEEKETKKSNMKLVAFEPHIEDWVELVNEALRRSLVRMSTRWSAMNLYDILESSFYKMITLNGIQTLGKVMMGVWPSTESTRNEIARALLTDGDNTLSSEDAMTRVSFLSFLESVMVYASCPQPEEQMGELIEYCCGAAERQNFQDIPSESAYWDDCMTADVEDTYFAVFAEQAALTNGQDALEQDAASASSSFL